MLSAIVVDDETDLRTSLSEYLEIKGVSILATGQNGKDAFELYQHHKPDVVLLDFLMPQYDGLYAITRIRDFDPDAKIVMLTASVGDDTFKRLVDNDVSGIIYKPYDMDVLINNIERVIAGERIIPKYRPWKNSARLDIPQ
ncbi:response regulator [Nitrosopumilus sp. b1]|uniref:response regulator n=1 Tax=Nitrosopumilus sp. b1 TaxID=2109907 RepID=UPI0015F560D7|nr:response regulator [Nitrosopumilus sp. b1]KAF6242699.1 response regulator [Nitrosopumilus sp. b1]